MFPKERNVAEMDGSFSGFALTLSVLAAVCGYLQSDWVGEWESVGTGLCLANQNIC